MTIFSRNLCVLTGFIWLSDMTNNMVDMMTMWWSVPQWPRQHKMFNNMIVSYMIVQQNTAQ